MGTAIALTLLILGGLLVYSGFKDFSLWDNILGVVKG
jgi:hypothetical protein